MKSKPIVAIMYDFDKTLSTRDMQEFAFIPSLGMESSQFWQLANDFGREQKMDGILAYMYASVRESRRHGKELRREDLVNHGKSVEFYNGVESWFDRINKYGEEQGEDESARRAERDIAEDVQQGEVMAEGHEDIIQHGGSVRQKD